MEIGEITADFKASPSTQKLERIENYLEVRIATPSQV
jgi:hypothetical protein